MLKINNNLKTKPNILVEFKEWQSHAATHITRGRYSNLPYGVYDDDELGTGFGHRSHYYDDYDDENDIYTDGLDPRERALYLKNLTEAFGGTCQDDWQNWDDEDYSKPKTQGHSTRRGKKKKKLKKKKLLPKSAINDIECSDDYDALSDFRRIYYYPHVLDKDEYETFTSIWELDDYLQRQGIDLPNSAFRMLADNEEIHCCCIPTSSKTRELLAEASYGALVWESENSLPF